MNSSNHFNHSSNFNYLWFFINLIKTLIVYKSHTSYPVKPVVSYSEGVLLFRGRQYQIFFVFSIFRKVRPKISLIMSRYKSRKQLRVIEPNALTNDEKIWITKVAMLQYFVITLMVKKYSNVPTGIVFIPIASPTAIIEIYVYKRYLKVCLITYSSWYVKEEYTTFIWWILYDND